MKEEWKDVKGYEGLYKVSNLGNVYSYHTKKILKQHSDKYGYRQVVLCFKGKPNCKKVHRLVAIAFIDNPNNKPAIDHINGIKNDNKVNNLRWVTNKENSNNPITLEINRKNAKTRNHFPGNKVFCLELNRIFK